MNTSERKAIDLLVNEFWRLGYFTLSRKLGTYLPEPSNIGRFSVDVIGRQREKYAIGITLTKEDIFNPDLIEKINYLASRKSKASDKPILLLIGVPEDYFQQVKEILSHIDDNLRKNIKLKRIIKRESEIGRSKKLEHQVFFS
jgi:hypothetical protein